MEYRASSLLLVSASFTATAVEFVAIWALFQRFGNLRGWTLPEVALFYGLVSCSFSAAQLTCSGFDDFSRMVREGLFDRLLLRPRSAAFQVACGEFPLIRTGRLVQGLAILLWSLWALHMRWTAGRIALLILIEMGGACIFAGLFIIQATMSFWTVETLEIMNTVTYGGTEVAQYPMTIFRPGFRLFFTFVIPPACVNVSPAGLLLGRAHAGVGTSPWCAAAPLAGPLFLLIALRLWRLGVRHYASTGS